MFAGIAAAVAIVVDEAVVSTDRVHAPAGGAGGRRVRHRIVVGTCPPSSSRRRRRPAARWFTRRSSRCWRSCPWRFWKAGRAHSSPLVIAYAVTVAAAMLVAFTVTPALTHCFSPMAAPLRAGAHLVQRLGDRYEAGLQRFSGGYGRPCWSRPAWPCVGIVAVALVPLLGTAVLPDLRRPECAGAAGRSARGLEPVDDREDQPRWAACSRTVPGVATVGGQVGRAVTGDRVVNVSSSDIWVTVASDADYDETMAAIDGAVNEVADVTAEVSTYTTQKMRDVGALTGGSSGEQTSGLDVLTGLDTPLAVRLFGQDPVVLAAQAERVKELMSGVDGLVSAADSPAAAAAHHRDRGGPGEGPTARGQPRADVRRAEATLLQGIQVGSVFEEQKVFDVVVQGAPANPAQHGGRQEPADRPPRRGPLPARRCGRRTHSPDRRRSFIGTRSPAAWTSSPVWTAAA